MQRGSYNDVCAACRDSSSAFPDSFSERLSRVTESATAQRLGIVVAVRRELQMPSNTPVT
jgi:hypothetical protein